MPPYATPAPSLRPGRRPTVTVVVPTRNEERNLPHVFERLPGDVHEVILVDGGSTDRTVEVARELRPDVRVVQQTRTGKGNALACGFAAATGDIVVMIDADGSTDPAEIPRFVDTLLAGADFAKGSRFRAGGDSHDITRLRRLGNEGLNGIVNTLFGTRFTDLCYGYNAFWRRLLPALDLPDPALPRPADGGKLWGDGFEIETLINIRVAAHGYRVREVASVEHARIHGDSNLNTFRDGTRVLRTILSEFRRLATAAPRPARPAAVPVVPMGRLRDLVAVAPGRVGDLGLAPPFGVQPAFALAGQEAAA
ncbi:glycosyltransferase family 2 protein [Solwaraspora sp. WMMD1047]|uniref:glycosyltransferase family 2 protein n=1 Tax=Solwaraspora sp. WMMD1047 TaxID=3016102 RepID=UPI0024167071|nr:glycosyltransferase family 2 protein [Solwaraspora sp. WMMD1047]MDG4830326.1 glycosyltransferase family 2 protein [Solwaraspora sp. WMMD1047]